MIIFNKTNSIPDPSQTRPIVSVSIIIKLIEALVIEEIKEIVAKAEYVSKN